MQSCRVRPTACHHPSARAWSAAASAEGAGDEGGVYRPPRLNPVSMELDEGGRAGTKERRQEARAAKRAQRSTYVQVREGRGRCRAGTAERASACCHCVLPARSLLPAGCLVSSGLGLQLRSWHHASLQELAAELAGAPEEERYGGPLGMDTTAALRERQRMAARDR